MFLQYDIICHLVSLYYLTSTEIVVAGFLGHCCKFIVIL